ncbi:MAG: metal ABC transporter ATP-binding protein [Rhodothermales bacterium]|nr:metal ABC transporter ATP-binding protein [Rhodothermales bacterium]MBO6781390.1 metal ABC transporter ATP-binding protein [Rhodothermales bacterium]
MSITLAAENLHVRLGERDVLSHVSFLAEGGDLVAVLGPNGSGKSTLVRTLIGLTPPTAGQLLVLGHVPSLVPAGSVGYVPQIKTLDRTFPARAVELVASARSRAWPGRLDRELRTWSERALGRVGAAHLSDRQVNQLSGGELQRVYLARAMAREVEVLLLDEPEAGVDAAGTADLYALLDDFREQTGGTVVLVTHDWDAAVHHASKVLLLKGRQIAFGTPADALSEPNVRAAFGHVGHAHGVQTAGVR